MNMKKINKIEEMWKEQQKHKEVHYLPRGIVPVILVIAFIISDYTFISQLLDFYFYDEAWRGILASIVIAILIDVTPVIIAACIMIPHKRKIHYIGIGSLTSMLAALFGFLGYVRINSAELIFSIGSTSLVSAAHNAADMAISPGQAGMSWLFVVLPIATSVLSFIIGIISDSSLKETYTNKVWGAALYDDITHLEAEKIELKHVLDSDFDGETDAKYALALSDNKAEEELTFDKLKLTQAFACKNPQAAAEIFARKID